MAKSTGRKVARAASTGATRSHRGRGPVGFYGAISLIVILGLALTVYSRYQFQHPTTAAATPPTLADNWHVAYAVDICGTIQPNLKTPAHPFGITTFGDGLIDVHPRIPSETGHNATLGKFVSGIPGFALSSSTLSYPGHATEHNGNKCNNKPAKVQVKVWSSVLDKTGTLVGGNPADVRLANGQLITIAFVPSGAAINQPPSKSNLTHPAIPPTSTPTPTSAPKVTTPAATTPTSAPSGTTTSHP
ncbi:MAG: hypothetical protein ACRD0I_11210 [Acidimicrobiales bacterium]